MGPYLSVPKKEKESMDGENRQFKYGATGMQGWRNTMEDTHIVELDLGQGVSFFGVYDGHGGHEVAYFVREHLIQEMKNFESFKKGDYEQSLKDIYLRMDEMLRTTYGKQKVKTYKSGDNQQTSFFPKSQDEIAMGTGCTACSALITQSTIYVANAGDSRAVLAKKVGDKVEAIEMSEDHKPDLPTEKSRIEKAGGFVEDNRVKGILNLSRSIGDLEYKQDATLTLKDQMITAEPEIRKEPMSTEMQFLIIACDGIWDCLTSQEAVDFTNELIKKKDKISGVIEDMFDKIIAADVGSSGGIGCDNMTCIIVQFKQ